jgi:hypothetical protein
LVLKRIEGAYEGLVAVDSMADLTSVRFSKLRGPWLWTPGTPPIAARKLILPDERLLLGAVQFESPGFWEFVGSLNPLEQIRRYLNDRHGRRQDREYREEAERDRLRLENELLRTRVLRERVGALREVGFAEPEIRHMLTKYVVGPFEELGQVQDRMLLGPVDDVEIEPDDDSEE